MLRTPSDAVVGYRGGVLVSDSEGPALPVGWRCGADTGAGWGLSWEGSQSCAQSFAKARLLYQDSGKPLLAKRLVKSNKFIEVLSGVFPGQRALLVLGCANQHLQSLLLWGLLNRAQLGCSNCRKLYKTLSSHVQLMNPKIESGGRPDSKASKSLRF